MIRAIVLRLVSPIAEDACPSKRRGRMGIRGLVAAGTREVGRRAGQPSEPSKKGVNLS